MMKLLYTADVIASRIADLGASLSKEFAGHKLIHTVVTMNGSVCFAADLCRRMTVPQVLHFTGGSYFQGHIKQEVALNAETLPGDFGGAPVLIIEDILDAGSAARQLKQLVADRKAGSITIVTLFKRVGGSSDAAHVAFSLPRELFVVGYGLDMDGRFRELKDIYTFETTVMTGQTGNC
jgi:hypoxanthine phosphoribosyltransferase